MKAITNTNEIYVVYPFHQKLIQRDIRINTVHESHKEYTCDSCSKLFSNVTNLKSHNNTFYEGQKTHKCSSCGKLFSEEGNLHRHKKKLHHWCKYCDEDFGDVKEVNEHQNLIHDITKRPEENG